MKYFNFIALFFLICTSSLFSQSIITKSGLKVKAYYGYTMTDRLKYPSELKNNRDYILYSEIDTITGDINTSLKEDILKFNNSVVFVKDKSIKISKECINKKSEIALLDGFVFECIIQSFNDDSVTYSNLVGQDWNTISNNRICSIIRITDSTKGIDQISKSMDYSFTSNSAGDYLTQAGNNYLLGVGLGIAGGAAGYLGTTNTNYEFLVFVGAGMALSGFVCTIIGHTKLIKAGKMMNQNKRLSFHPASSGVGLALNF